MEEAVVVCIRVRGTVEGQLDGWPAGVVGEDEESLGVVDGAGAKLMVTTDWLSEETLAVVGDTEKSWWLTVTSTVRARSPALVMMSLASSSRSKATSRMEMDRHSEPVSSQPRSISARRSE